jgi:hypothetical protein
MTGIHNFERSAALGLALLFSASADLRADDIRLEGNTRLTGTVRSIGENGSVELMSELSEEPIVLKGSAVREVTFSAPAEEPARPGAMVELANGDVLPVVLEELDERRLVVSSAEAGRLEIPREMVRSLHLGIYDQRVIYSGPDSLDNWIRDREGSKNWSYENGVLTAEGSGQISRRLEPASQFILRFTLGWQNNPNFQLSFADPLLGPAKAADRYLLQFNNAGLEIKRMSAEGPPHPSLITLNRPPDQFPGSRMKVEIRVDRLRSILKLYLNGEPEGRFIDPIGRAPTGGGISLFSNAPNNTEHEITQLEVLEWDEAGDRHRTEERGDPARDSLIGRSAERWSGRLAGIRTEGGNVLLSFKSEFQEEPIEIPDTEVSTVFFAEEAMAEVPKGDRPFVLRLRGNGVLSVTSCTFDGTEVRALHPLLGQLTLRRSGVSAFARAVPPTEISTQ